MVDRRERDYIGSDGYRPVSRRAAQQAGPPARSTCGSPEYRVKASTDRREPPCGSGGGPSARSVRRSPRSPRRAHPRRARGSHGPRALAAKRRPQRLVRAAGVRHREQAARVAVESVHDARSGRVADGGQLRNRCRSPLTSVPSGWPAPGCTMSPAGLSTTITSASSLTTTIGMACGLPGTRRGSGSASRSTTSPSSEAPALDHRLPADLDRCVVDQQLHLGARPAGQQRHRAVHAPPGAGTGRSRGSSLISCDLGLCGSGL